VARVTGTPGAVALVVAGWRVGHSGGALVYQHAATAYVSPLSSATTALNRDDD
jgi:hypothetical protein